MSPPSLNLISPYSEEIYPLIQEYLNANRVVDIEKLVDYLTSKMKKSEKSLNRQGIRKYLNELLNQKYFLEGSRLSRDDILSNSKRKQIYECIAQHTCLYPYQIKKMLHFPNQILIWHLEVLTKFEFVKIWEIDSHQVYYPSNVPVSEVYRKYFLQNSKASEIYGYIKANQEICTQTHLSSALNMHPQTVRKYLKYLTKFELISTKKKAKTTFYFLPEP